MDYGLGTIDQWASFTLIRVLSNYAEGLSDDERVKAKLHVSRGYVFVIDPKFGNSAQFKLPAGHRKNGEDPLGTAVREAQGETGISIPSERFTYITKELGDGRGGKHWKCYFVAYIFEYELRGMNDFDVENEGEKPKYFTVEEFYQCVRGGRFRRDHFAMLEKCALILPFGRDKVA